MTTFNKGIRTQAGKDLANRVMAGKTSITYSRLVFSSEDLSDKSDDELSELTDVEPQELAVEPDTIDLKATDVTDPETEVRAIAKNDPLTTGLHVRTYGLYAKDDSGNEILFGVALDDNPAYLPPHESGDQDQYLTYEWDTALKDTDNIKFTNTKMVFVNFDELNRYKSAVNATVASLEADDTSLSSHVNDDYSNVEASLGSLQTSAASYTDYRAGSVINQANANMETNRVSLSNSVNGLPHWVDINYTRSNVAPSLANSARNDANGYTYNVAQSVDSQFSNKQDQINNRATIADRDWTRNVVAPSLANSAMNQANSYANDKLTSTTNSLAPYRFLKPSVYGPAISIKDFNDMYKSGTYCIFTWYDADHKPKNVPFSDGDNIILIVIANWEDVFQFALDDWNGTIKSRHGNIANGTSTGGWTPWKTVNVSTDDINNLQNQINDRPTWYDANQIRDKVIPSLANSAKYAANGYADSVAPSFANSAEYAANGYTDTKANSLNSSIESNVAEIHNHTFNTYHLNGPDGSINDLNDLINNGIYCVFTWGKTVKNCPTGDGNNIIVRVIANHESVLQYATNDWHGDTYFRGAYVNGKHNWTPWKQIQVTTDDINNLQNQINNKATTADRDWTRNVVAPSLATNAMNQANAYTNGKVSDAANSLTSKQFLKSSIYGPAISIKDFNDMFNPGTYCIYTWTNRPNNAPFSDGDNIILIVIANWEDVFQFALDDWNGTIKSRHGNISNGTSTGGWTPWKTVNVSTDDINNLQNQINSKIQTANDEGDAQNKSNQTPGTLFVYSD